MNNIKIGSNKDGLKLMHTIVGQADNGQTGKRSACIEKKVKTSDNETNTKL